jgi:hypothetical protein
MAQPDYRFETSNIGAHIDANRMRASISCVTLEGKAVLIETDRIALQEMCRQIQRQLKR